MMILGGQEFAEEEFRFIYGDGQSHWSRIRLVGIQDDGGETRRIIGIISDIEDQKCRENNLVDHARRDPLTGAFNKKAVREEIETLLLLSSFRQGSSHCLLLIDIDDFKQVNDHFGHAYGDQILMELVKNLTEIFRASDIIGRIGGDEFIVLMKELREADDVTARARHVLKRV
ncbi:GGDEF domain-containing protein, partial [Eubacterium aggregans]|uniref:GGDEF domain-containing protein n=1 Tax=Eubacterium aggregans TaxID=81409 RepID=UPI003F2F95D8